MRGLEDDAGNVQARQPAQGVFAGGALGGHEAFEQEAVAGLAGYRQRRQQRGGTGHRHHRHAGVLAGAHQPVARVADQRRAGVADQRAAFAVAQARHQFRAALGFVVVVAADQTGLDAQMVEQRLAVPGVLGGHPVHLAEHLEGAAGQVVQVTDRCADHIQRAAHGGRFPDWV